MIESDSRRFSPGPAGPERRQHPRAAANQPLTVQIGPERREVRLRDLSAGGICFFSEEPVPEMTMVKIELELPAQEPDTNALKIEGRGAVVRCMKISPHLAHYEIAVFLHDMMETERRRLGEYVSRADAIA